MDKIYAAGLGIVVLAAASTASADDNISRSYDLVGFDAIDIAGVFELDVEVGPDFSIDLIGPENELDRVKVSVKDGMLTLDKRDRKKGEKRRRKHGDHDSIEARITLPNLISINVSGVVDGGIKGVDTDHFEVDISGVGDMNLAGSCGTLDADVSGVGELDAEDLQCRIVNVSVSGVGDASVYASEEVDAKVSGMGDITVTGSPERVTKKGGMFSDITVR